VKAFAAPYAGAARREAVGTFVADIPLEPEHPSAGTLDAIAEGVRDLGEVPVLLLWGPGDPVFSDRYLVDLLDRMPHADVHRYEGARHLVSEDAPALVDDLWTWVADLRRGPSALAEAGPAAVSEPEPLCSALERRAATTPDLVAVAEMVDGRWREVTWGTLAGRVDALGSGLRARGVRRGDRVAVLITPGADLIAVIYACWRIGASVVVTDAGLGVRGIHRALRGAGVRHIIGIPKAMALVRVLGLPGRRIATTELAGIARIGAPGHVPAPPAPGDEAVVVFTSGSTGPAKGVVYRHRQVGRTRDLLRAHYAITDADSLVAAFAPWAVLGPALGIASVLPDMDVTSPRTLKAAALADAVATVHGTLLWASPAAFGSVLSSAGDLTDTQRAAFGSLRLVLGAGAPVSAALLHGMARLCPSAQVRTPYGMTEALPVTDVTIDEIVAAGPGDGVLVGRPLPGVEVRISAVDDTGAASGGLSDDSDVLGEIVVRAAHTKDHYDRLWATERASTREPGWHRTGDVGHLDVTGRLWIGGRLAHVVTTSPARCAGGHRAEVGTAGHEAVACVGSARPRSRSWSWSSGDASRRRGPLADVDLLQEIRSRTPVAPFLSDAHCR
jgi:acyl-CoA synthetase (AMP-forming)/AMP-acid ligase II